MTLAPSRDTNNNFKIVSMEVVSSCHQYIHDTATSSFRVNFAEKINKSGTYLRYLVPGTYVTTYRPGYSCRGMLAVAPDADHPSRTLTRTRTLLGDLCLDSVACECSRLIQPKRGAVHGGCVSQNARTRVCINIFVF